MGKYRACLTMDFSTLPYDTILNSRGTWTMIAKEREFSGDIDANANSENTAFHRNNPNNFPLPQTIKMVVTADDQETIFNTYLEKESMRVGDTIQPIVEFAFGDEPFAGKPQVTVEVIKPGAEFASILDSTAIKFNPNSETEGCVAQKIARLKYENPKLYNSIFTLSEQTVNLTAQHNHSIFKLGPENPLLANVPGVYKITYNATGKLESGEIIRRTREQSLFVDNPKLDVKPIIIDRLINDTTSSFTYCPTFTTVDGETKYIGPGV